MGSYPVPGSDHAAKNVASDCGNNRLRNSFQNKWNKHESQPELLRCIAEKERKKERWRQDDVIHIKECHHL